MMKRFDYRVEGERQLEIGGHAHTRFETSLQSGSIPVHRHIFQIPQNWIAHSDTTYHMIINRRKIF
jgi:hypothetical protein